MKRILGKLQMEHTEVFQRIPRRSFQTKTDRNCHFCQQAIAKRKQLFTQFRRGNQNCKAAIRQGTKVTNLVSGFRKKLTLPK